MSVSSNIQYLINALKQTKKMTDLLAALGNTNKNDIRASLAGPSDHRTGLKSPASISKASTDKGKQPEKPLNFFQQPRPAVSSPRANPGLSDDSDFIDEELPAKLTPETFSPRNRINSRGQKRVDYKEKPATIEEFEI